VPEGTAVQELEGAHSPVGAENATPLTLSVNVNGCPLELREWQNFTRAPLADVPPVAIPPPVAGAPPMTIAPPVADLPPVAVTPPVPGLPPVAGAPPLTNAPPVVDLPPVAGTPPVGGLPPVAGAPPVLATLPVLEPPPVPSVTVAVTKIFVCPPMLVEPEREPVCPPVTDTLPPSATGYSKLLLLPQPKTPTVPANDRIRPGCCQNLPNAGVIVAILRSRNKPVSVCARTRLRGLKSTYLSASNSKFQPQTKRNSPIHGQMTWKSLISTPIPTIHRAGG